MTIGEKIFKLRTRLGLSQEELADKLNVSRQSISKWELNESTPQPAKLVSLCDLFEINADTLLREDNKIFIDAKNEPSTKVQNKYFGTDGFRGEANVTLTSEHAYKVGRFIGWYFSKRKGPNEPARIIVGKDTRLSSYMLEYSLIAGMVASGAEAYMLHVTTTPSVSYITRMDEFDCGVMITASHNPYYDNGIKIINKIGEKLDDNTAHLIELYIDGKLDELGISENDIPYAKRNKIGKIVDYTAGRNRYIGYLISLASNSYKRLQIGIDTANGASWSIAKAVFEALGAQLHVTGGEPNGTNINSGVGSTHIENLVKLVKEHHLDVGFAFDGDADRCIAVDENGNIVDGDKILYLLARRLKSKDALDNNTVVQSGTIRSSEMAKQEIINQWNKITNKLVFDAINNTVPPFSIPAGTRINVYSPVDLIASCGNNNKKCAFTTRKPNKRREWKDLKDRVSIDLKDSSWIGQVRGWNLQEYCEPDTNSKTGKLKPAGNWMQSGYDYRTVLMFCESLTYEAKNNAKSAVYNANVEATAEQKYGGTQYNDATKSWDKTGNTEQQKAYNQEVLGLQYADDGETILNPFAKPASAAPEEAVLTCDDGSAPYANGCCTGETYTDMGEQGFNCCPDTGGDCFPPITVE